MKINPFWLASLALPMAGPAAAHTGVSPNFYGFAEGALHPWTGFDHMLAMFSLGLWSYSCRTRAGGRMPAIFLLGMAIGGGLGFLETGATMVEGFIALSLLCIGALLLGNVSPRGLWAGLLILSFGIAHGYAHAAEIGADSHVLPYTSGFLISTAVLLICGRAAGYAAGKRKWLGRKWLSRGVGSITGLAGTGLAALWLASNLV